MKKKLLISFLGSIALIIGLCCFSGSALSEDDTKVLNYWFSQNGLSRIDSSVTANYDNFFCIHQDSSYYLYLSNDNFYLYSGAYKELPFPENSNNYYLYLCKEHEWNNSYICYKYKDINDTWNLYETLNAKFILNRTGSYWNSIQSLPYLSNINIPVVSSNGNVYDNYIDCYTLIPAYFQDNYSPLKDWYQANAPLENPFEDNSGLFFSTISNTMSTAYNSMINPLFIEFTSIGIVPFLFFFTAISIVIIWFMRSVFFG